MSEIEKEEVAKTKFELIDALERAKFEIQQLNEIFGPGTRVFDLSSDTSNSYNRLVLFDGQNYRITIDKLGDRR